MRARSSELNAYYRNPTVLLDDELKMVLSYRVQSLEKSTKLKIHLLTTESIFSTVCTENRLGSALTESKIENNACLISSIILLTLINIILYN